MGLTRLDRVFIFVSIGIAIAGVAFVGGLENSQTTESMKTSQQQGETTVFQQGIFNQAMQGPKDKDVLKMPSIKTSMKLGGGGIMGPCDQYSDQPLGSQYRNCMNQGGGSWGGVAPAGSGGGGSWGSGVPAGPVGGGTTSHCASGWSGSSCNISSESHCAAGWNGPRCSDSSQ